ncbi:hypothetical protein B0H19DRAFT_1374817 [Mycena capillaripes]|nr:hypothetical protein B0H19DRAFT_1374817 [Mycena capillaripes]
MADQAPIPPAEARRLLFCNDPPLDTQIPGIREFVAYGRARVVLLSDRIDNYWVNNSDSEVANVLDERDALDLLVRMHASVLAPIRRIPTEILCAIFDRTLPHTRRLSAIRIPTGPWRLALVCKHWRECALAHGQIWSSIHIDGSIAVPENVTQSYIRSLISDAYPSDALQTQILRAANVPLQLIIHWPFDVDSVHLIKLLSVVVLHGNRWTTADLIWYPFLDITVPWGQLTRLSAKLPRRSLFEILRQAPNLVECQLETLDVGDTQPVVLHRLHRMYLKTPRFIECIEAPNLRHLFIDGDFGPLSFLRRSIRHLTGLTVSKCYSASLIEVLEAIPGLSSLHLVFDPWSDVKIMERIITALTVSSATPGFCPDLVSIRIEIKAGLPVANRLPGVLLGMLESRCRGPSRSLQSIHLLYAGREFTSLLTRFKGLREEGLEVLFNPTFLNPEMIPP